ncbi:DUF1772 domain-containing protein [Arachnia propionica]|uniref:DUF1772 domain-containing protein n=1 Tax=Arachnia propionica TaxID=1750 RepID=A0A3P1TEP1_9ACTN|nr:anthrone oxygenase family protein [Arachnia propionica]RRD07386.1 DUF1772 domain-containing protein [Arachnia propionica]
MFSLLDALAVAASVANGLLAGLFLAFACAVAPGLRHVDDAVYVQAFRSINRVILNGWFLLVFFAAPLTATAHALLETWQTDETPPVSAWTGAVCSVLTFAMTVTRNVPLNTQLDRAAVSTASEQHAARGRFEERWNWWNLARTMTSISALLSLVTASVLA